MATPIIQSVGSVSGAGTPGEGRNDLVAAEQVNLSDTVVANVGAVYFWEFEDTPLSTAPAMVNPTTATPHFLVDANAALAGSYRVKCTVNGVESSHVVLAKPLRVTGGRIPSFQERLEYNQGGNAKGWHEAETVFKRAVDNALHDPGPGKAGDKIIQQVWAGGRESHNSNTPLIVGAFSLNPNDYALTNSTVAFKFNVIAANGTTPLTSHVELYNITDGEVVTSSQINVVNSTNPTKYGVTLTTGVAAGTIKTSGEKIYECRVFLDVAPADPSIDTIELYKAVVQVEFTVTTTP